MTNLWYVKGVSTSRTCWWMDRATCWSSERRQNCQELRWVKSDWRKLPVSGLLFFFILILLFFPAHLVGQLGGRCHPGLQFGKRVELPGGLQNLPPAGRPQARVGDRLRCGGHSGWVMPPLKLKPHCAWEANILCFVHPPPHHRQDQQQQSQSHRWR